MKTLLIPVKDVERKWFVVDAQDQVLGRMAAEIAFRLRGKHKPGYAPFMDVGDFIVVVNADKIRLTGNKMDDKVYYRHTGYLGGLKETTPRQLMAKKPTEVLRRAVRGMLPKTSLGRKQLKKLKIYAGPDHPHQAQQPEELSL
ncbi:MAG: 50S ribosomal protein L13 [Thermodesulfobacteriota bacterium]